MIEQEMPPQQWSQQDIDKRVFELYDEYCHGYIDRREFMRRAGSISVAGVSALAMAQAVMPQYARAQTISFTDTRIKANYVFWQRPWAPICRRACRSTARRPLLRRCRRFVQRC